MSVFVLDKHKIPLMPCSEKRARLLLARGRARIHKLIPFSIRLIDRTINDCVFQPITIKLDPGATTTGVALVRVEKNNNNETTHHVLHLSEITHRGNLIKKAITQRAGYRRRRRNANLRHRTPRFLNRTKPKGWLAPSLRHRVETTVAWVRRYLWLAPITNIAMELVRFDTHALSDVQVAQTGGVAYQQGELAGYEVREYLLEKWNRSCAYCDKQNIPLQIEHVVPKSKGGSNRVSNLTLACEECNQSKGNQEIDVFLAGDLIRLARIRANLKKPLAGAAAMNSTRWALWRVLTESGLPVTCSTGGRTKWNRTRFGIHKTHALDAACVGKVDHVESWLRPTLDISCMGRGSYQRTNVNSSGFPRGVMSRAKMVHGFQTGDIVRADVSKGVNVGIWKGRVAVRASGSFNIRTTTGLRQGISWKYCKIIQRGDGYGYLQRNG